MNESLEKIDQISLDDNLSLKNKKNVKIKVINDYVTAYFFLTKVLSSIFNKNEKEIARIIKEAENNGFSYVCAVSEKKAEQLLEEVGKLKEEYLKLTREERMKYGTPPYLDGNIKNLTFEVENNDE